MTKIDFKDMHRKYLIENNIIDKIVIDEINLAKIYSYDEKGNKFPIKVILELRKKDNKYGHVLSFGSPFGYYLSDLEKNFPYPDESEFCIDISGRNHLGSPVCVSSKDMNICIKIAHQAIEILNKKFSDNVNSITIKRCQTCLSGHIEFFMDDLVVSCNCKNTN